MMILQSSDACRSWEDIIGGQMWQPKGCKLIFSHKIKLNNSFYCLEQTVTTDVSRCMQPIKRTLGGVSSKAAFAKANSLIVRLDPPRRVTVIIHGGFRQSMFSKYGVNPQSRFQGRQRLQHRLGVEQHTTSAVLFDCRI
jgi:hypothetical protein